MAFQSPDIIGSVLSLFTALFGSAGVFQNASNRAKSIVIRPIKRLEITEGADGPIYQTALTIMSVGRRAVMAEDLKRPLTLTFSNSRLQSFNVSNVPKDSTVTTREDTSSNGLDDVLVVSFDQLKPKRRFDLTFAWTGQASLPALAHPLQVPRFGYSKVMAYFLALRLNRATVVGQYLIAVCLIFLATIVAAAAWYRVGHWVIASAFAGVALAALWYLTPVLMSPITDE